MAQLGPTLVPGDLVKARTAITVFVDWAGVRDIDLLAEDIRDRMFTCAREATSYYAERNACSGVLGTSTIKTKSSMSTELMWSIKDEGGVLHALDELIETLEPGQWEIEAWRRPALKDFDAGAHADWMWEQLDERLYEDDELSWEDGGPRLTPSDFYAHDPKTHRRVPVKERPPAWDALRAAVETILNANLDLSESGWVRTGETRTVEGGES